MFPSPLFLLLRVKSFNLFLFLPIVFDMVIIPFSQTNINIPLLFYAFSLLMHKLKRFSKMLKRFNLDSFIWFKFLNNCNRRNRLCTSSYQQPWCIQNFFSFFDKIFADSKKRPTFALAIENNSGCLMHK